MQNTIKYYQYPHYNSLPISSSILQSHETTRIINILKVLSDNHKYQDKEESSKHD